MGGACLNGGGTVEEMLLDAERMRITDRYEDCIYVRQMEKDKNKWIVIETDDYKGVRIYYINNKCKSNPVTEEIRCDNNGLSNHISILGRRVA